ncbi:hypothetical protein [Lysinibacter cavernae]|uniref:Uncharacterized protein n=1 Tax=Lysinibacter cavernae TaxID=1640652 RepID=A0A7X5R0K3_9MICO|nr:hypothetical protein [Lysinibacter cavernae]NIH53210.1 hypothetical protein [Lysinibacter cavernae]
MTHPRRVLLIGAAGAAAAIVATVVALNLGSGHKSYSEAEVEQLTNAYLDDQWTTYGTGGERPYYDIVRRIAQDEWAAIHGQCLIDLGQGVTIDGDSLSFSSALGADETSRNLAFYECAAKYPLEPQHIATDD